MSAQQPKTIACPSCGNINPYAADECIRCGFALGPIREVMEKTRVAQQASRAGSLQKSSEPAELSRPKEPAPPLPKLPSRPTSQKIGNYVDSQQVLVRGMGDRANEVAARFFELLSARGIQGVNLSFGSLIINATDNIDSRDYYFAERELDKGAVATMAVRIAPVGTDLFVEWRHYNLPPLKEPLPWAKWIVGLGIFLVSCVVLSLGSSDNVLKLYGILAVVLTPVIAIIWAAIKAADHSSNPRKLALEGFQFQDSQTFQLAVRATLEEAIDLAGISKTLIQSVSKEDGKDRRLI